jgi:hypothetical protein
MKKIKPQMNTDQHREKVRAELICVDLCSSVVPKQL